MSFNDLILFRENILDLDFCDHVIDKFESDENVYDGLSGAGFDKKIKRSKDLCISSLPEWKDEDEVFRKCLSDELENYLEYCKSINSNFWLKHDYVDTGYQIQRTDPGCFYIWHSDDQVRIDNRTQRMITFIWYLNDIKENGYTEFVSGEKIQPKKGSMLLFPATWTYLHRGYPPKKEKKYICTGWLFRKITSDNDC